MDAVIGITGGIPSRKIDVAGGGGCKPGSGHPDFRQVAASGCQAISELVAHQRRQRGCIPAKHPATREIAEEVAKTGESRIDVSIGLEKGGALPVMAREKCVSGSI